MLKTRNKIGVSALALYVIVGGVFFMTNPQQFAPILLLVPFAILFAALLLSVLFVVWLLYPRKPLNKKSLLIASIVASIPVFLLLLQSIGQLSFRDILTVVLIIAISSFYLMRIRVAE